MYPFNSGPIIRSLDNTYTPVGNWPLTSGSLNDSSGNGFNLSVETGTERYSYITHSLGGFLFDGSTRIFVSSFQASLALTGATSFLALCVLNKYTPTGSAYFLVSHEGPSETEAENALYSIFLSGLSTNYITEYISEHSTGTNDNIIKNAFPPLKQLFMIGFTRSAPSGGSSTVQMYLNGLPWGSSASLTTPTGGGSGRFKLGGRDSAHLQMILASVALYNTELTAAQMKERYNFCLGRAFGYI